MRERLERDQREVRVCRERSERFIGKEIKSHRERDPSSLVEKSKFIGRENIVDKEC